MSLAGGTGPVPSARATAFDTAGNYATGTICIPKAKGGRKPKLGSDPVWDVGLQDLFTGTGTNVLANLFTDTP